MTADAELLFADYEFATKWNDTSAAIEKLGGKDAHVTDALTLEWRGFVDPTRVDTYLNEAQVVSQHSLQLAQRCNASAYLACEQFADIHSGVQSKSAGEAKEAADPQDRSAGEANVGDHAKSAGEAPKFMPEVHVHDEDGTLLDKAPYMYPGICNVMLSLEHIQLPVWTISKCRKLRGRYFGPIPIVQVHTQLSIDLRLPTWLHNSIQPVFHPMYVKLSSTVSEDRKLKQKIGDVLEKKLKQKIGNVFEPAEVRGFWLIGSVMARLSTWSNGNTARIYRAHGSPKLGWPPLNAC